MYIVVEIQTSSDQTVSTLVSSYASQNEAESKFHDVLKYAAISNLPKHACIMFSEEGFKLRNECYKHEAVTPTPAQE